MGGRLSRNLNGLICAGILGISLLVGAATVAAGVEKTRMWKMSLAQPSVPVYTSGCTVKLTEGKEIEEIVAVLFVEKIDLNKLPGAQAMPGVKTELHCKVLAKKIDTQRKVASGETICQYNTQLAGKELYSDPGTRNVFVVRHTSAKVLIKEEVLTHLSTNASSRSLTTFERCD